MYILYCACAQLTDSFMVVIQLIGCRILEFLAFCDRTQNIRVGDETEYYVDVWSIARLCKAEVENISSYLERVELFFAANGVAENKRVPIFPSLVGASTYMYTCTLLRDLLAPDK